MTKKVKKKETKERVHYKEGDLVGGKVKGHPLWPGYIEKIEFSNNKAKYHVRFFGTDDTSLVTIDNLKLFKDFTTKDKACNSKSFKLAYALCQEKYDALLADKKEGKSPSPEHSPDSSSVPLEGNLVIREGKDDDDNNNKKVEVRPKRTRSVKQAPIPTPECLNEDAEKPPTLPKEVAKLNSPKAEGENRQNRAIAKLREKVDKKIAEKEAKKNELKLLKQSKKACKVLVVVNKNLKRLLQTLQLVRGPKAVVQSNRNDWNVTVRKYSAALSLLGKCIGKHYFRENPEVDPQEYQQARDILIAIIEEIKRVQASDDIPLNVKTQVLKFKEMAKGDSDVKRFINKTTDSKSAMLERKENDAK